MKTRKLVLIGDAKIIQKIRYEVPPALSVPVACSGMTQGLEANGTKCAHGSYIPANSDSPNHALYCSECHPYILTVQDEHVIYKA
jgi:hypothetical protein